MAGRTTTAVLAQAVNGYGEASILAHNECIYKVSGALTANSEQIYAGPCILYGIYVSTAISAHVTVIKDGTTAVLSLPASAAAGSMYTFPGIRFETSLELDPDDATTTGVVTFAYRPL